MASQSPMSRALGFTLCEEQAERAPHWKCVLVLDLLTRPAEFICSGPLLLKTIRQEFAGEIAEFKETTSTLSSCLSLPSPAQCHMAGHIKCPEVPALLTPQHFNFSDCSTSTGRNANSLAKGVLPPGDNCSPRIQRRVLPSVSGPRVPLHRCLPSAWLPSLPWCQYAGAQLLSEACLTLQPRGPSTLALGIQPQKGPLQYGLRHTSLPSGPATEWKKDGFHDKFLCRGNFRSLPTFPSVCGRGSRWGNSVPQGN